MPNYDLPNMRCDAIEQADRHAGVQRARERDKSEASDDDDIHSIKEAARYFPSKHACIIPDFLFSEDNVFSALVEMLLSLRRQHVNANKQKTYDHFSLSAVKLVLF